MIQKAAEIRKALVALVGALTALLAANVLPENVAGYVATAVAILAVFGVYASPNQPPLEPGDIGDPLSAEA